jgi:type 1 fimbriae regulatory protein FimB/type 1 fimbriae regulatory protein FimE
MTVYGKERLPDAGRIRDMGQVIALPQPSKMGKLPPMRVPNSERRSREYLSPAEVDSMIAAAKNTGRHGHRDATFILPAYRHAGRVSEVISWRRDQVDLIQGLLHVNRLKNGTPSVHPLHGPEIRALRQLFREYPNSCIFSTERKGPMTAAAVRKIVSRAGELAGLAFLSTPTCYGTRQATTSPPKGRIPGRFKRTWATRISSIRCAIPSCHRSGSRISGRIK